MFRFVTWVVVSFGICMGLNYYNTVERPDIDLAVALRQFENNNEAVKDVRKNTFSQNGVTAMALLGWAGWTTLCWYGPLKREGKRAIQFLSFGE